MQTLKAGLELCAGGPCMFSAWHKNLQKTEEPDVSLLSLHQRLQLIQKGGNCATKWVYSVARKSLSEALCASGEETTKINKWDGRKLGYLFTSLVNVNCSLITTDRLLWYQIKGCLNARRDTNWSRSESVCSAGNEIIFHLTHNHCCFPWQCGRFGVKKNDKGVMTASLENTETFYGDHRTKISGLNACVGINLPFIKRILMTFKWQKHSFVRRFEVFHCSGWNKETLSPVFAEKDKPQVLREIREPELKIRIEEKHFRHLATSSFLYQQYPLLCVCDNRQGDSVSFRTDAVAFILESSLSMKIVVFCKFVSAGWA